MMQLSALFNSLITMAFVGKVAIEGKVEHKFDMKPHGENLEEYGRLCRERTSKSMIKNRQIQVGYLAIHLFFPGQFLL